MSEHSELGARASNERVQSSDQQARDVKPLLDAGGWNLSLGAIAAVIEALDTTYGPPAHETEAFTKASCRIVEKFNDGDLALTIKVAPDFRAERGTELDIRHAQKAGEPQCSGLCSGLPDANCPVHGLKATLSEGEDRG